MFFQHFDVATSNEEFLNTLSLTRKDVHHYRFRNRVEFDPAKEYIKVIHPIFGEGTPSNLLGCLLDVKLLMNDAIGQLVVRERERESTTKKQSFVANPLSLRPARHAGTVHASESTPGKIERLQHSYFLFSVTGRFVTSPNSRVRCRDARIQQHGTTRKNIQPTNNKQPPTNNH